MKKMIYKAVRMGLLAAFCLTAGCGQGTVEENNMQNQENEITTVPTEALTATPVPLTEEEQIHLDMLERSVISTGNNERMKKVIEKARKGEDVTLAYIGGSITQGYNAGTTEIFAKLSSDYFRETYATTGKVNYVNAGLSGTPSLLGLIRSERDIFEAKPDVVFIEFAVNDAQDNQNKAAFESLLRKALMQEQAPAVVLLFSVTEDGYTCQTNMQLIGMNYGLPMISVPNAIQPEFDAGRMTWKDWADKNSVNVLDAGSFHEENGHEAFPDGWVKSADAKENTSFTFEIDCRSLFLVYKEANNATFGTAEVYVDGEKMMTITSNKAEGWYNPVPVRIFRDSECKTRKVEIRMQEGDEDKLFYLLAIGYCVE